MTKEEALARIKTWYLNDEAKEALSTLIPKFKESEDERVGKQLLNWFKDCHWDAIDDGTLTRDSIIAWLEKHTGKVEPKFKVGDIIKHNRANIVRKVVSVNSTGSYFVEDIYTGSGIELFNAEQNFHLWTIQDARNGDVIVTPNGNIFLFKEIRNNWHIYDHCGLYLGGSRFIINSSCVNGAIAKKITRRL